MKTKSNIKLKRKDRVKMTGEWMRSVGLFSDSRVGTVLKVVEWSGGSEMVEVLWDGDRDMVFVAATNLRRVGR